MQNAMIYSLSVAALLLAAARAAGLFGSLHSVGGGALLASPRVLASQHIIKTIWADSIVGSTAFSSSGDSLGVDRHIAGSGLGTKIASRISADLHARDTVRGVAGDMGESYGVTGGLISRSMAWSYANLLDGDLKYVAATRGSCLL